MNVSCPECRSVFRVDPTKIPATGVRARCSVCGGVIILGAGSSIEEEFGPPVAAMAFEAAIAGHATAMEIDSVAAPAPEFETPPPSAAPVAPRVVPTPAASTLPRAPTPEAPAVVRPPRPVTPPISVAAVRPATPPPVRPAAFPPRVQPPVNPAAASRPAAPAASRSATPARPLAPPISAGFPPRPAAAPAAPPPPRPTAEAPAPPRPASPTPARLPINPFLANDPNAKARRLSRALISDLVTYFPQRREEGLRDGTLRELFRDEIKKSYEEYVEQVGKEFADSTTHFQDALNEILGGGQKIF